MIDYGEGTFSYHCHKESNSTIFTPTKTCSLKSDKSSQTKSNCNWTSSPFSIPKQKWWVFVLENVGWMHWSLILIKLIMQKYFAYLTPTGSPSESVRCSLSLGSDILEELRDDKVETQHRTVQSKFPCAAEIAAHEDSKQTQPSVVKIVFCYVPSVHFNDHYLKSASCK